MAPLVALIHARRADAGLPATERAVYENFGVEERLLPGRTHAYSVMLGAEPWKNMGDFNAAHTQYLQQHIWCDKGTPGIPHTFDAVQNGVNFWSEIDDNVVLFRVESVPFALGKSGVDEAEFANAINNFHGGTPGTPEHANARLVLDRALAAWNPRRDRRPAFATTSDEIGDLLVASADDWPNAVRDYLGLGQYNPGSGRTQAVLLMRYTAAEVRGSAKAAAVPGFCIPTVLDGDLNPFFFPTPRPGPGSAASAQTVGRSVNLRAVASESDYKMGLELVHSFVEYRAQHIARIGAVARPVNANLAQLRGFHLSWLRLDTERDDFGCDLVNV